MGNTLNFFGSYHFKFPTIGNLTGYTFAGGSDGGISRSISMTVANLEAFGAVIIDCGFCISSSNPLPTVNDSVFSKGKFATPTVASITHSVSLGLSTTYYIRGYVQNVRGITYSNVLTLTTSGIGISTPNVSTNSASSVGNYSATCGGNVTSDGGASVTSRGVCWNTTGQLNQLGSNYQSSGSGTGPFTVNINTLNSGTTYYFQAYATNSQGTSFGSQLSFTTSVPVVDPNVSTLSYSGVTQSAATCGGNVISEGTYPVVSRGICYSSSNSVPTTSNSTATNGSGSGDYTCNLSGLISSTRYYYRAYATNSQNTTIYGSVSYFDTLASIVLPSVSTLAVWNIEEINAISGVNVTSEGTYSVTGKGICYAAAPNSSPTISDTTAYGGNGVGSVTLGISGLTANTTYYVRAYATNSQGTTVYGSVVSFTTLASSVTVPTVAYLSLNATTNAVAVSANVLADGGATVTSRGFYWSYNSNFSGQSTVNVGSGTGAFETTISGLTPGSTIYVKAFAINSAGTDVTATGTAQIPGVQNITASISVSATRTGNGIANVTWYVMLSAPAPAQQTFQLQVSQQDDYGSTIINVTVSAGNTSGGTSLTYYLHNPTYTVVGSFYDNMPTGYTDGGGASTVLPTLITLSLVCMTPPSIGRTSVILSIMFYYDGPETVHSLTIYYGLMINGVPQDSLGAYSCGTGSGSYGWSISGLTPNTQYWFMAMVSYGAQSAYQTGNSTFTTLP